VAVVDVGHAAGTDAAEVASAETSHATPAEATDVASAKASHASAGKASHVASAAATTVSSATAATTARLRTRGEKAAGKQRTCQNRHRSCSHDILHWNGRALRLGALSDVGPSLRDSANLTVDWRWQCAFVVSIQFSFSKGIGQPVRSPERMRMQSPNASKLNSFLVEKLRQTVSFNSCRSWAGERCSIMNRANRVIHLQFADACAPERSHA
jgi:hypothetical protein